MAITYHPGVGQILMCDFSQGFKVPEMVKKRPVLIIASAMQGRENLVTVLPLSTVRPDPIRNYHYQLHKKSLPQLGHFQGKDTWIKADMIYTVGFHRLDLIRLGKKDPNTGKRMYFKQKIGRDTMKDIYQCMLYGLNLGMLGKHL